MVKLPGAVTKGGHEPATQPLPFLTWVFSELLVSEIKGCRYTRFPYHILSSGSRACEFAHFSGRGHPVIGVLPLLLICFLHHWGDMGKANFITP